MTDRNRGNQRDSDSIHPTPYTFVPVEVEYDEETANWYSTSKVYDVPGHAGIDDESRFSGELRVRLRTLTPTLVGARQSEFTPKTDEFRSPFGKSRKLLEPWRLRDGRVVIPGSSLKGMLRHYLSALLNAPMEKVAERYYSYRPNVAPGGRGNLKGYPIQLVKRDGIFYARLLNPLSFTKIEQAPTDIQLLELRGIDGQGWMDFAFRTAQKTEEHSQENVNRREPKRKWISRSTLENAKQVLVPPKVIQAYCLTQRELADEVLGHLSNGHPLSIDEHGQTCIGEAVRLLGQAGRGCYLRTQNILYAEVQFDPENKRCPKVVSLGHHFRYRWGYRDSVRRLDRRFKENNTRPELAMHYNEYAGDSGDGPSSTLTFARALFGFAYDEKLHDPIFDKSFKRLAGRISINHAVEGVDEKNARNLNRFLADGAMLPLVELGSPKASAVEFYVKQRLEDNREGMLTTYGDLLDSPDWFLSGRKFYRHQPPAARNSDCYEAQGEERQNHRALVTRYASRPETEFKFAIRFNDLKADELGALLFVLGIDRANVFLERNSEAGIEAEPSHALKIGHARPLGWGSVTTRVERALLKGVKLDPKEVWKELNGPELKEWEESLIRGFLDGSAEHSPNLTQCLEAWSFAGRGVAKYPVKREPADAPEATIFDFHTDLRRRHAKARKQIQNAPICETERGKPEFGRKDPK